MEQDKKYSLPEANQYFAVAYNNNIWKLWEKKALTAEEHDRIINLAHASLVHWTDRSDCKKVNVQRGEYMIAMAYVHAGRSAEALYYAEKCKWLSEYKAEENDDFDLPYAYLVMAMALTLNNRKEEANFYLKKVRELGDQIQNANDKIIFDSDFKDAMEKVLNSL